MLLVLMTSPASWSRFSRSSRIRSSRSCIRFLASPVNFWPRLSFAANGGFR